VSGHRPQIARQVELGELNYNQLRSRAEAAPGRKFDQRAPPPPLPEQRINTWITSEKARS
jgi:hypothetical protein